MKKLMLLTLAACALLAVACKHETKSKSNAQVAAGSVYACPMDCEKGKTYPSPGKCPVCGMNLEAHDHTYACPMHPEVTGKEGDKCPKCGMALVHSDGGGAELPVKMEFKSDPATLEAGKAALLSFTPKRSDDAAALVPLDVQHEKKIHLIVVSDDLAYFEHIHPEYQADGSYQIKVLDAASKYAAGPGQNETYFRNGGKYMLFADYKPAGGNHKVDKIELNVSGKPAAAKQFVAPKMTATAGAYTFSLEPASHDGAKADIVAGQPAHIKGVLKKGGQTVDANTLQNYLGAKAHVVVIGVGTKEYLHVHPDVADGAFDMHTTFAEPGIYRAWVQFHGGEKVETAEFVLEVKPGTPGAAKPGEAHKGH